MAENPCHAVVSTTQVGLIQALGVNGKLAVNGTTTGSVWVNLRVEGACILAASALAYAKFGYGWGTFALFFLAPDISLLGYLAGPRIGAALYNSAHSLVGAVATLTLGVFHGPTFLISAGVIWCAHIGFDRMLGYGLKYSSGFAFTHLGLIGRARLAPTIPVRKPPATPRTNRSFLWLSGDSFRSLSRVACCASA